MVELSKVVANTTGSLYCGKFATLNCPLFSIKAFGFSYLAVHFAKALFWAFALIANVKTKRSLNIKLGLSPMRFLLSVNIIQLKNKLEKTVSNKKIQTLLEV